MAMQTAGCKQFVLSSTCATYGEPDKQPIAESQSQNPINPYGKSKLMLESVLSDCDRAWGLKSVCLRYFNACGAHPEKLIGEDHDPETHLIPLILDVAAGDRESIRVFGTDYPTPDGTCVRDYIHVEDLATAHVAALEYLSSSPDSLACNLGTGNGVSVKEVIAAVETTTGRKIPIILGDRRPGDPPYLVADPSLALEKLGWKARYTDIHDPIAHAWKWRNGSLKGRYSNTTPNSNSLDS
jgi:UDP-glucose-4-epimerase GalE